MGLSTRTKIQIARLLSSVVRGVRRMFGRGDISVWRRGRHRWELDLRQGIDFHIFLFGAFEAHIPGVARQVVPAGGVVLDIGANVGAHTLAFADITGAGGSVYAFEPTDYAYAKLVRNVQLNPDVAPRIRTIQALLVASASQHKPEAICSSWPLTSTPGVHEVHRGEWKPLEHAQVATLDEMTRQLRLSRIDLVKLDVDGNELFVLQGGTETLMRHRPAIIMELAPYLYPEFGYRADDLARYLRGHQYSCQLLPTRKRIEFERAFEIAGQNASANVLLVAE